MKLVQSDRDGDTTFQFLKEQMAKFNLDEELLEALTDLIDNDMKNVVAIEPSVIKFIANDDALSTQLVVFKNGGSTGEGRAIPFIELTPAIMKVLTHMRDILEMSIKKSNNIGSNGQKS